MMTRKHFEAIAEILRETSVELSQDPTDHERGRDFQSYLIRETIAEYLHTQNPNFDRARFYKASQW